MFSDLLYRLRALFRRQSMEEEMDEELRAHFNHQVEKYAQSGLPREEALRRARLEFGGLDQVKEECREARGVSFIETTMQDLRYGIRALRKNPGFTVVAVVTLALGIGANTAVFSLIDSVMLRNLPVNNPAQLVQFADSPRESMSINEPTSPADVIGSPGQWTLFSYPLYLDLRDRSQSFQGICAFQTGEDTLTVHGEGAGHHGPAQVAQGKLVSGNFFSLLGVNAVMGRALAPEDDRPGAPPVAVVSFGYWRAKLGGVADVLGRVVDIDRVPVKLVGVMPPGFFGERVERDFADFWMPLSLRDELPVTVMPQAKSLLTNPNAYWLGLIGRLKPEVTKAQANAEVNGELRQYLMGRLGTKITVGERRQISQTYISLAPGGRGLSSLRHDYAEPLRILQAIVALVLLIACANVGNLLLSRATGRQKEMAMRAALGATRGRLMRQMLTESLLLAVLGSVAGALLASQGVTFLISLVATKIPLNISPDLPVLGFSMLVLLLTAILCGLAPALKSAGMEILPAIKGGSPPIPAKPARWELGKGLVAFQIAVSMLLLVGAGLLIRSLANLENQNLGFRPQHVLLVSIDPVLGGYPSGQLPGLYHELLDRIGVLPGVRSVSIGTTSPMSGGATAADVSAEGQPPRPGENTSQLVAVGPRYFETEGMRIVAGREITRRDVANSTPVAVVNQAFARRFLPEGNPVGKRFSLGSTFTSPGFEIAGVAEDARYTSAREAAGPIFFLSAYQMASLLPYVNEIEIRTAGNAAGITAEVRKAIQEVDSNLLITGVTPLTQQVNDSLSQQRAFSDLTGFFGILGLALACVGLYGIMAYNVARRTREMGIRMAMGAQRAEVLRMVLRQTLLLIAVGITAGIPVALAAARLIASQLYGLSPTDWPTVVTAALVMAGAGLVAGYVPARRATKVDPMVALRCE
jgi:predicted permease